MNLENIPMIGIKTSKLLNNLSIYTPYDLIRYYPYKFDILKPVDINNLTSCNNICINAVIESQPVCTFFKGKNKLRFRCVSNNKMFNVSIYNRLFIKKDLIIAREISIIGNYNDKTNEFVATNLYLNKIKDEGEIKPIYHLCKNITNKKINSYINSALISVDIKSNIPQIIINKYGFINEKEALMNIHNPSSLENLKKSLKTLKYEEILSYMMNLETLKKNNMEHNILFSKKININNVNKFIASLPFELTKDQSDSTYKMIDIIKDDVRMNALLQGDVGSGKTIVAFILAYACINAGYQVALMAPTEVLAQQHFYNAKKIFKDNNINIDILTGKINLKQKKDIYNRLEKGQIDFIIGTHALISDATKWNKLGLIITDEQHRFGVNQRLLLKEKGIYADLLMMSATPIPRTYALIIYKGLDVFSIKTMPKGRLKVITRVKKKEELKDVLNCMYIQMNKNHQVYVISPMIDSDDNDKYTNVYDLKRKFSLAFKNKRIEILHGKLNEEEKKNIIFDYKNKKIDILISTTIVEVGVDVESASVIVIFDANKFGLSQLHQLRGRVGRSNIQSYCFLICDKEDERLNIMEKENDGFKISDADFKLRGQGDIFGLRQSGNLIFKLCDIRKDYDLFLKVKQDIKNYLIN